MAHNLAEPGELLNHNFTALVEPALGHSHALQLAAAIDEVERITDIGELLQRVG